MVLVEEAHHHRAAGVRGDDADIGGDEGLEIASLAGDGRAPKIFWDFLPMLLRSQNTDYLIAGIGGRAVFLVDAREQSAKAPGGRQAERTAALEMVARACVR